VTAVSQPADPSVDPPKPSKSKLLSVLGPGLVTGASDDDPSGIATYSQTGAQFGYATTWTLLFTYPLMAAVQIISARIGRTTGKGIAGNLRAHYPNPLVLGIVGLLLIANVINIGADLSAMGDTIVMLVGGPHFIYVVAFGVLCILLQVFMRYASYVSVLKWLALALLAYVATLFFVHVEWGVFARNLVIPAISLDPSYVTAIVAIFGTTISPYLFFWQSSQEVEDIEDKPERDALIDAPEQAKGALRRIELDTLIGMAVSNLIALAIMLTTAATLHKNGVTSIQTSAQAAEALKPVAGAFASLLFSLGIVGTGLLSVPVLGGSAAYAVGEALKWPIGLNRKLQEAKAFYAVVAGAVVFGMALTLSPIDPMQALFWSAVINGVVAVPVMVLMMLMSGNRKVMGEECIGLSLTLFGWLGTGAMALSVIAMGATYFM
jgi:NRAMP (natural resistance-associated macrophage protein)-like metal ion transporter